MAVPHNPFGARPFAALPIGEDKLISIIESLREGLIVIRDTGIIESINPAARSLLSTNVQSPVGRHFQEIVWVAAVQRFISEIIADGFSREDETIVDAGYGERHIRIYGTSVEDQTSDISYLIVITDITNLKKLEKMRRDFVANVSHELKTPITVIQGFVETLLSGPHTPEDSQRFLESIARQTSRLTHLFDDLLMLSRLEQEYDPVKISRSPQTMLPILTSIVQSFEMKARDKDLAISLECIPECIGYVNVNLFEQAIVNLIQNAIEHTPSEGRVAIRAEQHEGITSISVKDTGCGIEPDQIERIFERFYRIDKGRARKHGGTGLGLSIVKHIAQLHGGRVTVRSVMGEGSEFILEVPVV